MFCHTAGDGQEDAKLGGLDCLGHHNHGVSRTSGAIKHTNYVAFCAHCTATIIASPLAACML